MTVDRYQSIVKGLNTVERIHSHYSPEHRQREVEGRQLKVVDIRADTLAMQNEVIQWKAGSMEGWTQHHQATDSQPQPSPRRD